jgi:tetratricopeptide (TPR) repeat protein
MKQHRPSQAARLRMLPAAVALACAALATPAPAHAQFGGLFNSIIQQQQQQQAAEQKAQVAKPSKKWAPAKPIAPALQAEAKAFADKADIPELAPLFERLYIEGERNATLNLKRIGLAALALNRIDIAEKALEAAAFRIDLIYADNAEAQKAKSLWTAEKIKDFKGEPYERVMAYFYRGLVYAAKNDFQNARAMFKQADYQDTVAEAEQYAGDFALMPYMAGWASYCDGDKNLAKDFLQQAIKGDKSYSTVSVEKPVLLLVETGRAPFKFGGGKFGELLQWAPWDMPRQAVKACTAGSADCFMDQLILGADVGFQATTRGGRPIDAVLNGKASFKEGAQNVAQVAGTVGAVGMDMAMMSGNRDMAAIGMIGMFAGLAAQGVAGSTQAQADIREWEQLPGHIWLATGATKQVEAETTVTVEVGGGPATTSLPVSRLVDTPSCQLYWGRTLSPLSLLRDAGPVEAGEHKRDPVFRNEIAGMFGG